MRHILISLRKSKKLTQEEVADAVGISRAHYGRIESGDRTPSLNKSLDIKKFFNYYNDDIFHKEDDEIPSINNINHNTAL